MKQSQSTDTECSESIAFITSWNKDCQEKYQQPQICRWYHPHGRKWRTKEPLDEGNKEWKSWLKTQHSKKILASGSITSWQTDGGEVETVTEFIFLGSKITVDSDCSHKIKRCLFLGRKAMTNIESILKSRGITLPTRVHYSQSYGFSRGHDRIGPKEGWGPKNRGFCIMVLEKTLESPLNSKEIKAVNLKRKQPWTLIGRTDVQAEAPILWPPDAKSWLTGKDPDVGKDWEQEKGVTEDKMVDGITESMTWVWPNSERQWRIRKPGVCSSRGSQIARHDLLTEQQQTRRTFSSCLKDPQNSSVAFREGFLKQHFGLGLCTFFLWIVDEVTGWCWGNLYHKPRGSNQSGIHGLVVSV